MRIEITFGQLTAWLVAGVAEIDPSDFAPTPVEAATDGLGSFSRIRLSVDLPEKYLAATSRPVIALADEIGNVTAATPELTRETGLRLANQGEGWVPVAYVELPCKRATRAVSSEEARPSALPAPPPAEHIDQAPSAGSTELPPTMPAEAAAEQVIPDADPQPTPMLAAPMPQVALIGDAPTILADSAGPAPRRKSRAKLGAEAAQPPAKPKRVAKKRATEAELPLDGGLGLKS